MVICPTCQAENPEGTKLCVKCGSELPKAQGITSGEKARTKEPARKFGIADFSRDVIDGLWLLLIIFLVLLGFIGQATHWSFRFTDEDQAKLIQPSVLRLIKPVLHMAHVSSTHTKAPSIMAEHPQPTEEVSAPVQEEENPNIEFGNAQTFYEKGKKQYDQRHYLTSFNYLKQSLMADPTYAKAYFGLGYLYSRFGMNDAAVRMYEMALRFDPTHVDSINNLAIMYKNAGNEDDALALLQKAVNLDDQNADLEYNLGSIYLDKDQPQDALQAFQKAATLKSKDASIYNDMALTYEKLGQKQDAEDTWQKVLQYANGPDLLNQAKTHLAYLQAQS